MPRLKSNETVSVYVALVVAQCTVANTVVICHRQARGTVELNSCFRPRWVKNKDSACVDAPTWPNSWKQQNLGLGLFASLQFELEIQSFHVKCHSNEWK